MNANTQKSIPVKSSNPQGIVIERGISKLTIGQSRVRITYADQKDAMAIPAIRSILMNAAPF